MPTPQQKINASSILYQYRTKSENYWIKVQDRIRLGLFRRMMRGVPAYRKFISSKKITVSDIKTSREWGSIPNIDKRTYFHQFPLTQVVWDKSLVTEPFVLTSTSGSTGVPTYFPRDTTLDLQYSVLAEYFLYQAGKKPTLLVNCFGMGVWIGGLITYSAFRHAALRGFPLTIITPGINKKEIFHCLNKIAPDFDSVILAGYPPFIKDILDEAASHGIRFLSGKTRLLFAAESFTEQFRDYLARKAGVRDVCRDTLNIYGSAELGAMAFETPGSIFIRRLALKHPKIWRELFESGKIPTLAQYNPNFCSFEAQGGEVLATADSAVPMVRYRIGDRGGVYRLSDFASTFRRHGISLASEAGKAGVTLLALPFVYVYERSDFSTKLYGAIIYPGPVREALLDRRLARVVTGKFTLLTKFDRKQNVFLEIHVELLAGVKPTAAHRRLCQKLILNELLHKNAEYKNNYASIPRRVLPHIVFWQYEHPTYFKPGIKQKWVADQ